MRIGTNVSLLHYGSPAAPFVDLMNQAGPWISLTRSPFRWDDGRPIDMDEFGRPRSLLPGQSITRVIYSHAPASWDALEARFTSSAEVRFAGATTEVVAPGHVRLTNLTGQVRVEVTALSEPFGLSVRVPGERGTFFTQKYRDRMALYDMVRTMDWSRTNYLPASPIFDLEQRADGIAVPYFWHTLLHRPLWVCAHHLHTAEDIRALLAELQDHPYPVYIEHSNEVWNGGFPQARYAMRENNDNFNRAMEWHAERTQLIANIRDEVFPDAKVVLGAHAYNMWHAQRMMNYCNPDFVAIAPYFGGQLSTFTRESVTTSLDRAYDAIVDYADAFGDKLIAYEGGQHLVSSSNYHAVADANRAEWMGDIYREYLAFWQDKTNNALFCHYSDITVPNRHGAWGAAEHPDNLDTPKFRALQEARTRG